MKGFEDFPLNRESVSELLSRKNPTNTIKTYLIEAFRTQFVYIIGCETSVKDSWSGENELNDKGKEIEHSHVWVCGINA
jgi:hypothetical protein